MEEELSEWVQVWSCGGGTQSAAIAALIVQGRLPKPDIALMVDTNREKSGTWEYVHGTIQLALSNIGLELQIIDRSKYATVDLYSTNDEHLLIPGFTTIGGGVGKLDNFCSGEWKRRVIERYLRKIGVEKAEMWLGMSVDEMRRVRSPQTGWIKHRYPLIDLRMRRRDCVNLVESSGWPTPPRSSCWMCPNMADKEWREMKRDWPEDFAAAVKLEREARERDEHFFLHDSCVPLDQVSFENRQGGLFERHCDSGLCFV